MSRILPDLESRGRHVAYLLKKYFGKEPDVQHNREEKLRGKMVLDPGRAKRTDVGYERGLCDQSLLLPNSKETGDDT